MEYYIYINNTNDDHEVLKRIHPIISSLGFKKKPINKKYDVIEYQNESYSLGLIPNYKRLGKDNSTKIILTFPGGLISEGEKKLKNLVAKLEEDGLNIKEVRDIRNKVVNINDIVNANDSLD